MLTLTRRQGETLLIGSDVRVTVKDVKGRAVRLAIDAPKDVTVLRVELVDRQVNHLPKPSTPARGVCAFSDHIGSFISHPDAKVVAIVRPQDADLRERLWVGHFADSDNQIVAGEKACLDLVRDTLCADGWTVWMDGKWWQRTLP